MYELGHRSTHDGLQLTVAACGTAVVVAHVVERLDVTGPAGAVPIDQVHPTEDGLLATEDMVRTHE